MSKATKMLIALAVVGAGAATALTLGSSLLGEDDEATGARHLVNQIWIERIPSDQRDMIGHLVFVRDHGRIGAVGRSSRWRHFVELFHWGLEGSRLKLYFPQEEVRGEVKVKTWKCQGEAPDPFELCLKITQGKRSVTYYSMEDWVIDGADPEQSLEDLTAENPELLPLRDLEFESDAEIDFEDYAEIDELPFPE